jgi:hypothetical protein
VLLDLLFHSSDVTRTFSIRTFEGEDAGDPCIVYSTAMSTSRRVPVFVEFSGLLHTRTSLVSLLVLQ